MVMVFHLVPCINLIRLSSVGGSNYTTAFAALNAQDLKTQLQG